MRPICRAATVRELDRRLIEDRGLPSLALMEAAVAGLARALQARVPDLRTTPVCVATGPGNNGGDGWALARWLHGWGVPVHVWPVVDPASADAQTMADISRKAGVRVAEGLGDAPLVIDALFGTGLARPLEGPVAEATTAFRDRRVVAIDLPSGLEADTGRWLGPAFDAELTLTLARLKPALFAGPGATASGVVEVVDIGLDVVAQDDDAVAWLLEPVDLTWPVRAASVHKGRSGHVLVVAGSVEMAGAAILACHGALSGGAGLVTLAIPPGAVPRLASLPPEVMIRTEDVGTLPVASYDAVVAGPGLGGGHPLSPLVREALGRWWLEADVGLIYDADALRCTHPPVSSRPRVLTPHPGEAGRMLQITSQEVQADRLGAVTGLTDRGTVLLKGPYSLVADDDWISVNPTGSPALATGGSGDVLSGLIGALLARGLDGGAAARLGAWVHGAAGDLLWARCREGWRASDIAAAIPEATAALASTPGVP